MEIKEKAFDAFTKAVTPHALFHRESKKMSFVFNEPLTDTYIDALEKSADEEVEKLYGFLIDHRDFISIKKMLDDLISAHCLIIRSMCDYEEGTEDKRLRRNLMMLVNNTIVGIVFTAGNDMGIIFPQPYIENYKQRGFCKEMYIELMENYNDKKIDTSNNQSLVMHGNINAITTREDTINKPTLSLIDESYTTELGRSSQGLQMEKTIETKGTVAGITEKYKDDGSALEKIDIDGNDTTMPPQRNNDLTPALNDTDVQMEKIISKIIPCFVNEEYRRYLSELLRSGRVGDGRIDIRVTKGCYKSVSDILYPLFESKNIPHKYHKSWYDFVRNNFTSGGKDIPKSTIGTAKSAAIKDVF
ncbi:hypothetical protein Barb4_04024 [Bacteroidales bacterium Barb4]|nr:hypothetical protein Barb4_04024 [Bacteroidales bacterium Barb4]